MRFYKSYNFRNKDPVIDILRTAIDISGMHYSEVSEQSGVSVGTLYNWFNGPTQRPQFCCVQAVARVLHQEFALQKRK